MRDYEHETTVRVAFIRDLLTEAGARGVVFGNSGGKDSALVGILCKMACEDTVGLAMPCGSPSNYGTDMKDAMALTQQFGIAMRVVDLSAVRESLASEIGKTTPLSTSAMTNVPPRLRMTTLYAVAASENRLVAGTGNKSEWHMGYFTKWGDGAYDFNPIADLVATEIHQFLRHLGAPESIITKAPSAGLFDGQTDEGEMGVTYRAIDTYLHTGEASDHDRVIIERYHKNSRHKRALPVRFGDRRLDHDH